MLRVTGIIGAKIRWTLAVFAIGAAFASPAAANSANPPLSFTGAFREPDCTQCHGGTPNRTGTNLVIANVPAVYTPGATVPIQVQITDPTAASWGFELSARFANGSQAGTFTPSAAVSVRTGSWGGFAVQYAANSVAVSQSGNGVTFMAMWTAPPDSSGGTVIFDAAGVSAASGTSSATGNTFTAEARSASGAPQINPGGVVSAASFQGSLAVGELVSIFGQNLSLGYTTAAASTPLPGTLDSTIVQLNNQPCPVLYVSPSQINVQLPFEYSGALNLTVGVGRIVSPAIPVTLAATAPSIFASSGSGNGAGAILHADYSAVSSSHPAKAGEIVLVFATGLGRTNPPIVEGQGGTAGLVEAPVSVTIGGVTAFVNYAGIAPGFAGLYQINTTVPTNLQDAGNLAIYLTAGAVTSPSGVTITVQ